jgi:hypothetical protein
MVVFVVILNVLVGLGCLGVAWATWQVRRKVAKANSGILSVERSVYRILHPAPTAMAKAQRGSQGAREKYAKLEVQTQKMRQIVSLLSFGRVMWVRRGSARKRV